MLLRKQTGRRRYRIKLFIRDFWIHEASTNVSYKKREGGQFETQKRLHLRVAEKEKQRSDNNKGRA